MDKRAVIRSVIAVLIFAAVLVGYNIFDIISHPQFYIYGNVVEAEVNVGWWAKPVKTTDRHEIDVLLSCIRKVKANNDIPPGVDTITDRYDVVLTFADGSVLKYEYRIEISDAELDPFREFRMLFVSSLYPDGTDGIPDVIEIYM